VVVLWLLGFHRILSEWWWRRGIPWRPNCQATPQGLDQKSKIELVPKMMHRRDSDAGQSRRRWVGSCRIWCLQMLQEELSCIGMRSKEGCDCGSKVWTVHSRQDGEGSVPLRSSEGIWQKKELWERFCLQAVQQMYALLLCLCNDRGLQAWNMGGGECCSCFGELVCQFIPGKSRKSTQEARELERSQISQKDFGWRNTGAVKRRTTLTHYPNLDFRVCPGLVWTWAQIPFCWMLHSHVCCNIPGVDKSLWHFVFKLNVEWLSAKNQFTLARNYVCSFRCSILLKVAYIFSCTFWVAYNQGWLISKGSLQWLNMIIVIVAHLFSCRLCQFWFNL